MQMEHCLSGVLPVVHHDPEPLQLLLLCHLSRSYHQLSQDLFVPFLRLRQASESVLLLGNEEYVNRSSWLDVPKGKNVIVFVDNVGVDLLADEFVKNGLFGH